MRAVEESPAGRFFFSRAGDRISLSRSGPLRYGHLPRSNPMTDEDRDGQPTVVTPFSTPRTFAPKPPVFAPEALLAGRFRMICFIARGGMGEVYEAEDQVLGERVALKTVRVGRRGRAGLWSASGARSSSPAASRIRTSAASSTSFTTTARDVSHDGAAAPARRSPRG